MTLIAQPATAPANGLDTDTSIVGHAAALALLGFGFAVRYVSRGPEQVGDLTANEAQAITTAGLALMIVQHAPPGRWTPSSITGALYGSAAAQNAVACAYPAGATLWCDMENMRPGCGTAAIAEHVNAWWMQVNNAGFDPGLYFTADMPPENVPGGIRGPYDWLYQDLRVRRYWRGLSADAPQIPIRGVCMQQTFQPGKIAGIDIDRDTIMLDHFQQGPSWAVLRR